MQLLIRKTSFITNEEKHAWSKLSYLPLNSQARGRGASTVSMWLRLSFISLCSLVTMSFCFRAFVKLSDGSWPSFVSGALTGSCRCSLNKWYQAIPAVLEHPELHYHAFRGYPVLHHAFWHLQWLHLPHWNARCQDVLIKHLHQPLPGTTVSRYLTPTLRRFMEMVEHQLILRIQN